MNEFPNPTQGKDKSPFADLKKSISIHGVNSGFYDLPGYPDLVVRKSVVPPALEHIPIGEKPNIEGILEQWKKDIAVLKKAAGRCGIRMVKADAVVGHNPAAREETRLDDDLSLFFVTERIDGKSLEKFERFDGNLTNKIDIIFRNFATYFYEAYIEDEDYWHDFKPEQIMYGTAPGEKVAEFILVDIDPVIESWKERLFDTESDSVNKEQNFWYNFDKFAWQLNELEKKCEGGLPKTHQEFERIMVEMPVPQDQIALTFYKRVQDKLSNKF